jgi:hypothetical protein
MREEKPVSTRYTILGFFSTNVQWLMIPTSDLDARLTLVFTAL